MHTNSSHVNFQRLSSVSFLNGQKDMTDCEDEDINSCSFVVRDGKVFLSICEQVLFKIFRIRSGASTNVHK